MKLPTGWFAVAGVDKWYCEYDTGIGAVVRYMRADRENELFRRAGWYAWSSDTMEDEFIGVFKTAREAFKSLGLVV